MVEFRMVGLGLHWELWMGIVDDWVDWVDGRKREREGKLGGFGEGTEFTDVAAARGRVSCQTRE